MISPGWAAAAIVAGTLLAYAGSMGGPLVFDDLMSISQNPTIRHFSSALMPPSGGLTVSGRPILNLSFAINYAISGTEVWSYHALNVLIHSLAALALFGVIRRTSPKSDLFAFAVALLWVVHPLQSESVTYVVQRAESLMGLFYLLTLYFFIRGISNRGPAAPRTYFWFGFSWLACILGMGTKEVMVTAPVLVFFYDRTFISGSFRAAWTSRKIYYMLLASTWIWCGLLVAGVHGRGGTAGFGAGVSWQEYGLTQFRAIAHYLRLAVWPKSLIFDYGPILGGATWELALDAWLILGLAAVSTWLFIRRLPLGFLGIAFFLVLLPSSSVVPIPTETMAEHRMYLSLAAFLAAVVGGISTLREKLRSPFGLTSKGARNLGLGTCLTIAAILGIATTRRNTVYRSAAALWADAADKLPGNARARNNFGFALAESGDMVRAEEQFRAALALAPDFASAHVNLGNVLVKLGRSSEAVDNYRSALRFVPQDAAVHDDLGTVLLREGRTEDARTEFVEALRLDPNSPAGHFDLGCAMERIGQAPRAIAEYRESVRLDPDYWNGWYNLANLLAHEGKFAEASNAYASAVNLRPEATDAHVNYGNVLTELRRPTEAMREFQAALRLQPNAGDVHDALGDLLMSAGRRPEAKAEYEAARRLDLNDAAARTGLERLEQLSLERPVR